MPDTILIALAAVIPIPIQLLAIVRSPLTGWTKPPLAKSRSIKLNIIVDSVFKSLVLTVWLKSFELLSNKE